MTGTTSGAAIALFLSKVSFASRQLAPRRPLLRTAEHEPVRIGYAHPNIHHPQRPVYECVFIPDGYLHHFLLVSPSETPQRRPERLSMIIRQVTHALPRRESA